MYNGYMQEVNTPATLSEIMVEEVHDIIGTSDSVKGNLTQIKEEIAILENLLNSTFSRP